MSEKFVQEGSNDVLHGDPYNPSIDNVRMFVQNGFYFRRRNMVAIHFN